MQRSNPSSITSLSSQRIDIEKKLKSYYQLDPFPIDLVLSADPDLRDTKVMTLVTNGNGVVPYLSRVRQRAQVMYIGMIEYMIKWSLVLISWTY